MRGIITWSGYFLLLVLLLGAASCDLIGSDEEIAVTGTWIDEFGTITITTEEVRFTGYSAEIVAFDNDSWNGGESGSGSHGYMVIRYTEPPSWNTEIEGKYMVLRWQDLRLEDDRWMMSYSEGYKEAIYFDSAEQAIDGATDSEGYFAFFTTNAIRQ